MAQRKRFLVLPNFGWSASRSHVTNHCPCFISDTEWNYTSYATQPFDDSTVSTFTLNPSEIWAAA